MQQPVPQPLSATATRAYIRARIGNSKEAAALLTKVHPQDRLILGARLGDPKMVEDALNDGARVFEHGTAAASSIAASALFLVLYEAKFSRHEEMDALLGRYVNGNEDTKNRVKVIALLAKAGARAGDDHPFMASHGTLDEWFKHEMEKGHSSDLRIFNAIRRMEHAAAASKFVSEKRGRGRGED